MYVEPTSPTWNRTFTETSPSLPSGRQWRRSRKLRPGSLSICLDRCRLGSGHYPYSTRQLWECRLRCLLGFRHQVGDKCDAHRQWTLLCRYDRHVRGSGICSRLRKLWSLAPPGLDGCLLGFSIRYDGNSTAQPVACCYGSFLRFLYCLCELSCLNSRSLSCPFLSSCYIGSNLGLLRGSLPSTLSIHARRPEGQRGGSKGREDKPG